MHVYLTFKSEKLSSSVNKITLGTEKWNKVNTCMNINCKHVNRSVTETSNNTEQSLYVKECVWPDTSGADFTKGLKLSPFIG